MALHFGLPIPVADEVEIAVVQGVNNTIERAYSNKPGSEVTISSIKNIDYLSIEIHDTGLVMADFSISELKFDPEDPEPLPDGGMGLFILNQTIDKIEYFTDEKYNILCMQKNIIR
ncbi:ATP-binding protein [Desulfosediminicola ganghwensis]|uniref:ATP-binding protein n=1 Tax=Desulfosediminicola ganghwensis TaxID=2569540 RepID=UPI0010AC544C|nr:ATP-binding protein [Desulfosediminicola ganghwensis]